MLTCPGEFSSGISPSEFSQLTYPRIQAIMKIMAKDTKESPPVEKSLNRKDMLAAVDDYRKSNKIGKYEDGN